MERLEEGINVRCECVADNHGHPAGECEYMAKFQIRPTLETPYMTITLRVCSPCEAQHTRVATKKG